MLFLATMKKTAQFKLSFQGVRVHHFPNHRQHPGDQRRPAIRRWDVRVPHVQPADREYAGHSAQW